VGLSEDERRQRVQRLLQERSSARSGGGNGTSGVTGACVLLRKLACLVVQCVRSGHVSACMCLSQRLDFDMVI
jgi:hypothetical protein